MMFRPHSRPGSDCRRTAYSDELEVDDSYSLCAGLLHIKWVCVVEQLALLLFVVWRLHRESYPCLLTDKAKFCFRYQPCSWISSLIGNVPNVFSRLFCQYLLLVLFITSVLMLVAVWVRERELAGCARRVPQSAKIALVMPNTVVKAMFVLGWFYHVFAGLRVFLDQKIVTRSKVVFVLDAIVLTAVLMVYCAAHIAALCYLCEKHMRFPRRHSATRDYASVPKPWQVPPSYPLSPAAVDPLAMSLLGGMSAVEQQRNSMLLASLVGQQQQQQQHIQQAQMNNNTPGMANANMSGVSGGGSGCVGGGGAGLIETPVKHRQDNTMQTLPLDAASAYGRLQRALRDARSASAASQMSGGGGRRANGGDESSDYAGDYSHIRAFAALYDMASPLSPLAMQQPLSQLTPRASVIAQSPQLQPQRASMPRSQSTGRMATDPTYLEI